ncbi:MAG: glycoside hydrolase family 2 [Oscillospiraceae bacterium]|nr:glycoside hydrolase family 2 [Oscillospiraceae bacterium]
MDKLTHMLTPWGEAIDKTNPLSEYPRPQLRRDNWTCLNGTWEYAILESGMSTVPSEYDGEILVPYSPESLLSGVKRQLLPGQTLWYRRKFSFTKPEQEGRLILHFGAVDQVCKVYVNGQKAGDHSGGFWPFSIDITDFLAAEEIVITVAVQDESDRGIEAYGKQKLERGGIWYTAQSGIWQTVWTEVVPEQHIENIKITPLPESSEVKFEVIFAKNTSAATEIQVFDEEKEVSSGSFETNEFTLKIPNFRYWSPDDPFLYKTKITAGGDKVESYFGMRSFGIVKDENGFPRLSLNGKPIFHSGLLDQGYYSDGMYTPASDEAMVWEITKAKEMGFNMLRKHIKIEPLRWYYHCDRLGMLVWQDFVSGGGPYGEFVTRYLPFIGLHLKDTTKKKGFGRKNEAGRKAFERDMTRTVKLLYNVVSLSVWVPFNEGWGQFDAERICKDLQKIDHTRSIDHASGWHDQGTGDFSSYHVYYKPFKMKPDKQGRVQALTEFGGYSCPTTGHMATDKLFGYKMYKTKQELNAAIEKLYTKEIIPKIKKGLSATIYTQLTDIEDEINGILTYDRKELKLDAEMVREINEKLIKQG